MTPQETIKLLIEKGIYQPKMHPHVTDSRNFDCSYGLGYMCFALSHAEAKGVISECERLESSDFVKRAIKGHSTLWSMLLAECKGRVSSQDLLDFWLREIGK